MHVINLGLSLGFQLLIQLAAMRSASLNPATSTPQRYKSPLRSIDGRAPTQWPLHTTPSTASPSYLYPPPAPAPSPRLPARRSPFAGSCRRWLTSAAPHHNRPSAAPRSD